MSKDEVDLPVENASDLELSRHQSLSQSYSQNSSVASDAPSPYRRSRFARETRREALEKNRKRHPKNKPSHQNSSRHQESDHDFISTPQQRPAHIQKHHNQFTPDDHEEEKKSDISGAGRRRPIRMRNNGDIVPATPQQPPQQPPQRDFSGEVKYYRVIYRGVVALLSQPEQGAERSGCYLSYGEVFASHFQAFTTRIPTSNNSSTRQENDAAQRPASELLNQSNSQQQSALPPIPQSSTRKCNKAIRVDGVFTGGYAFDPQGHTATRNIAGECHAKTPKRSNIHQYTGLQSMDLSDGAKAIPVSLSETSSTDEGVELPHLESTAARAPLRCEQKCVGSLGFIFAFNKKHIPVVEPLEHAPQCERGVFFYRVVSTTPLPIVTGPCIDAPQSKAMVLPGSVLEMSFRMKVTQQNENDDDGVWFLRLSHRRGYISDRRVLSVGRTRPGAKVQYSDPLVKDVTEEYLRGAVNPPESANDGTLADDVSTTVSVLTLASSNSAINRHRRHRPPRRKRDAPNEEHLLHIPGGGATHSNKSVVSTRRRPLNHSHDTTLQTLSMQSSSYDKLATPSSNVSLLSDDDSMKTNEHAVEQLGSISFHSNLNNGAVGALSPDRSVARSSAGHHHHNPQPRDPSVFLMKVNAPRGLRILDAPHFQVNNLIHGGHQSAPIGSSHSTSAHGGASGIASQSGSIFQTMAGRLTHVATANNAAIFDSVSKTRVLPRGAVFEASKRMESSGAMRHQGAELIKLADNSGWAIVPHQEELHQQYRNFHGDIKTVKEGEGTWAFEEVGNAIVNTRLQGDASTAASSVSMGDLSVDNSFAPKAGHERFDGPWVRVVARGGAPVVCAPPLPPLHGDCTSPTASSVGGSYSNTAQQVIAENDSDVASSVGSTFLDAVFRRDKADASTQDQKRILPTSKHTEKQLLTIPCGFCVQLEAWSSQQLQLDTTQPPPFDFQQYARLRGGQGWIPLQMMGKPTCVECPRKLPPEFSFGSLWFRVVARRGIKVRLGPSKRAPSIKSEDGIYFRFECGEFLRASEIMTVYSDDRTGASESFAKLYRNRHIRLNGTASGQEGFRQLPSLTAQAEWVQIHDGHKNELFLQECNREPRIERHRQGWRYNVTSSMIPVKKGPSFGAEDTGLQFHEGETVVVIERVSSPDENGVTWLRIKEGHGWVHDIGRDGETLLVANSLRHRTKPANARPSKPSREQRKQKEQQEQIAYNTIIARLFHNDLPPGSYPNASPGDGPL